MYCEDVYVRMCMCEEGIVRNAYEATQARVCSVKM